MMNVVIVWLVLMTIGLIMTSWMLMDAQADRRVLRDAKVSNGRKVIVDGDVRSARVKVAMFAIFELIGVISILSRQEVIGGIGVDISRVGLLVGAGLLVADAILGRRVRQRLLSMTGEKEKDE